MCGECKNHANKLMEKFLIDLSNNRQEAMKKIKSYLK